MIIMPVRLRAPLSVLEASLTPLAHVAVALAVDSAVGQFRETARWLSLSLSVGVHV